MKVGPIEILLIGGLIAIVWAVSKFGKLGKKSDTTEDDKPKPARTAPKAPPRSHVSYRLQYLGIIVLFIGLLLGAITFLLVKQLAYGIVWGAAIACVGLLLLFFSRRR
ncbi:hypothetical protein DA01_01760 [Dehalococcoides mccartyi]|uniref:Uncharacterized protein n=1 Tax=Dehalococcoides mccartyi TaxID=61435 RepID=A0A0V8M549_9CHLR|nr:hypothetical protein [Dehalococcoides mccartyi]KSV18729.1 hypothetical protein DA01_01760 [Dehalococcoides mccartyi]